MNGWPERLIVAVALALMVAPEAHAQSVPQIAINACTTAVAKKARAQYPGARNVDVRNQRTNQISSTQRGVQGDGSFAASGTSERFSFHCTFDTASGTARDIDLRLRDRKPSKSKNSDNATGALVGLALGALIAGAIVSSSSDKDKKKKDSSEWWSPESGVKCSSKMNECYRNGQYNAKWTQRVYGY